MRFAFLIILFGTLSLTARGVTIDLTPDELTWSTYNPAKILVTANKLVALGPQDAYASLAKYVERPPGINLLNDDLLKRDNYLAWLCLLVYDPKPGTGLPIPMFGLPAFPNTGGYGDHGSMNTASWPRFPLAMSRGVPFLLVSGYAIAGFPEPGTEYLKRCHDHGDFHATAYPIPTYADASEALNTLISSSLWTGLNWKDDQGAIDPDFLNHEVKCLNEQIERMNPSFLERRFVGIHPSFFKAHESEIVVISLLIVLFLGLWFRRRGNFLRNSKSKATIILEALLLVCLVPAHAADVQPLNASQKKIANTVTDEVINRIKTLKSEYPELARFGDAPWFTRFDGGFRYDYQIEKVTVQGKVQTRALPGGCGIYFCVGADGSPMAELDPFNRTLCGGAQAGMVQELGVTSFRKSDKDDPATALSDAIGYETQKEMATTFSQLVAEYLLPQKEINLDTEALLRNAENPDPKISKDALVALHFHALTPVQLARIRHSFLDGKIPLNNLWSGAPLLQEKDAGQVPAFFCDIVAYSLKSELAGTNPHLSIYEIAMPEYGPERSARQLINIELVNNDPRYLAPAEMILESDTDSTNRYNALVYIARQPGDGARKMFISALDNSYRSIQSGAAELIGTEKVAGADAGLKKLLDSPSKDVRSAAAKALGQLGEKVPDPVPAPPLPDSARKLAQALWERGLTASDVMNFRLPEEYHPGAPQPPTVKELNLEWIQKRSQEYAAADDPTIFQLPIGPFLLAAALQMKDETTANVVYERMCFSYENDQKILEDELTTLAWLRFKEGLDLFQQGRDAEAIPLFRQVIAFSDVTKPYSYLDSYVRQSKDIVAYLSANPSAKVFPEPAATEVEASARYWISRLHECTEFAPTNIAENIRALGLKAVPLLIDALTDETPTRTVECDHPGQPLRNIVRIGDEAEIILHTIFKDYGLSAPSFGPDDQYPTASGRPSHAELQAMLRRWFKTVPLDTPILPQDKRDKLLLYPTGQNEHIED